MLRLVLLRMPLCFVPLFVFVPLRMPLFVFVLLRMPLFVFVSSLRFVRVPLFVFVISSLRFVPLGLKGLSAFLFLKPSSIYYVAIFSAPAVVSPTRRWIQCPARLS